LRVYDSNWNLLFNSSGATVGSTTHASFSPASSDISGLYVQWSAIDGLGNPTDAYNVGIDNVNFTVSAIATPEPASLTLFATGFIALAGVAGRRRSR
jgi:hypothetical protein